jgi:hypothetical protein
MKNLSLHNQILVNNIVANLNSQVLEDKKSLAKQSNSTQNSLYGIAKESLYVMLPINGILEIVRNCRNPINHVSLDRNSLYLVIIVWLD